MSNDSVAIANLMYLCAERFDAGDWVSASGIFEHAEIKVRGKNFRGSDLLLKFWQSNFKLQADGTPQTMHVITNPLIDIAANGISAICRSYYVVFQATRTVPLQVISTGRYLDAFEKIDGKWRFSAREYVLTFAGDLSAYRPTAQPL